MFRPHWPKPLRARLAAFSLVELMIVVAIIGVLAVIGIPTFRKFVQRARQAEAKGHLATIHKLEEGFSTEYSHYGNHLLVMGIGREDKDNISHYWSGFMDNTCGCGAILPPLASPEGTRLNLTNPGYYVVDPSAADCAFGRDTFAACSPSTFSATFDTYTAISQGAIFQAGRVPDATPVSDFDIWTMDEKGVLTHTQDGVK